MSRDLVRVQVSIIGRGVGQLSKDAARALVERAIDGDDPPAGVDVRIGLWRSGRELAWRDDTPKAEGLRSLLRGLLQSGRLSLRRVERTRT